jgi:hypothetical protein
MGAPTFTFVGSCCDARAMTGAVWRLISILAAVSLALIGSISSCIAADERNPFGVEDVSDPNGDDVQAFAREAKLPGDKKDDNAPQWAEKATEGKAGTLDGAWSSRWSGGTAGVNNWVFGTATVHTVKDRVYILYKDETGTYLIDAVRNGNRLVGRYINIAFNGDSTPWVGIIVDNERIDGIWRGGRWDLRRQLIPTLEKQVKDLRP